MILASVGSSASLHPRSWSMHNRTFSSRAARSLRSFSSRYFGVQKPTISSSQRRVGSWRWMSSKIGKNQRPKAFDGQWFADHVPVGGGLAKVFGEACLQLAVVGRELTADAQRISGAHRQRGDGRGRARLAFGAKLEPMTPERARDQCAQSAAIDEGVAKQGQRTRDFELDTFCPALC
jgi:hypothetical protein